jgi:CopG antitoxin of type II toxin-antitoxin system
MAKQKASNRSGRARSGEAAGPKKAIPVFKSEAEERAFWESHDSTEYVDWTVLGSASEPKAIDADNLSAPAACAARTGQGRGEQA